MADPRVCVIIPTLRNAQELDIALEGLCNQSWNGSLEVAVLADELNTVPLPLVLGANKPVIVPLVIPVFSLTTIHLFSGATLPPVSISDLKSKLVASDPV